MVSKIISSLLFSLFPLLLIYVMNIFIFRGDALATAFSALYGKLLVVMGIAFPMAEVISTYIPPSFYEVIDTYFFYLHGLANMDKLCVACCWCKISLFIYLQGFYLYLYIGSMVFLLFMYVTLIWGKPKPAPGTSEYIMHFNNIF